MRSAILHSTCLSWATLRRHSNWFAKTQPLRPDLACSASHLLNFKQVTSSARKQPLHLIEIPNRGQEGQKSLVDWKTS